VVVVVVVVGVCWTGSCSDIALRRNPSAEYIYHHIGGRVMIHRVREHAATIDHIAKSTPIPYSVWRSFLLSTSCSIKT